MTYFNPKIYNRENLKEEDRDELDFWHDKIISIILDARDDYDYDEKDSVANIEWDIISPFCDYLKERFCLEIQEILVSLIESYDKDMQEVEENTDYLYRED